MGVMHFFTNTADMAKRCLTLGWYISFPGPVTFTNMYDESIKAVPLDRLLIETDAPFAAPTPHRGQRNEPAYVEEVTKKVAAIRNEPLETILAQTVKNSRTFFSL